MFDMRTFVGRCWFCRSYFTDDPSTHSPHVLGEEPPRPPRPEERLHLDGRPLPRHPLLIVRLPGKEASPRGLDCYGRCACLRWVLERHDGSHRRLRRLCCCIFFLFFVSVWLVLFFFFPFLGRLWLLLLFGTRQFAGVGCGEGLVVVVEAAIPVGRVDGRVGGRSGA